MNKRAHFLFTIPGAGNGFPAGVQRGGAPLHRRALIERHQHVGEPVEESAKPATNGAGHGEDQHACAAEHTHFLCLLGVDLNKSVPELLDQLIPFLAMPDTGKEHGHNEHEAHGMVEIASQLLVMLTDLVDVMGGEDAGRDQTLIAGTLANHGHGLTCASYGIAVENRGNKIFV